MTEKRFFQSPEPIVLPESTPLVFLEGPVQGAENWQTGFAHLLLEQVDGIAVASPRVTPEHEANLTSKDPEIKAKASEKQVAYEFLARRLALSHGAIALWYATQDPSLPYNQERVFGKTTQIENGELWGWMMAQPDYPFVVGVDPEFQEGPRNSRGYIKRNHALIGIKEHTTLGGVFFETLKRIEQVKTEDPRPVPLLASQSIQRAWDQLHSE
ncbi:MAG: hypothetical protein WAQ27_05195 [Candidatus Microsaccharimonas sp.]